MTIFNYIFPSNKDSSLEKEHDNKINTPDFKLKQQRQQNKLKDVMNVLWRTESPQILSDLSSYISEESLQHFIDKFKDEGFHLKISHVYWATTYTYTYEFELVKFLNGKSDLFTE